MLLKRYSLQNTFLQYIKTQLSQRRKQKISTDTWWAKPQGGLWQEEHFCVQEVLNCSVKTEGSQEWLVSIVDIIVVVTLRFLANLTCEPICAKADSHFPLLSPSSSEGLDVFKCWDESSHWLHWPCGPLSQNLLPSARAYRPVPLDSGQASLFLALKLVEIHCRFTAV